MKRPQGFDRTADRATGPFGPAEGTHTNREAPVRRDTDTEPITIVAPTIAPDLVEARSGKAHAPDAAVPGASRRRSSSAAQAWRRARRQRRRYERGEVKRFTRRTRRRRAIWLICGSGTAAVLVAAVLVAFSPLMALNTIEVVGTSRLQPAAVQQALAPQLGKPLPLIDFGAVNQELGRLTLIRSYSTETHPPGTLVVRIVERQPIGLLRSAAGYNLVDQAGVVISSSADRPAGYPLITLAGDAASAAGTPGFRASASVLSALPASVLPQVETVRANTTDDVSFTLLDGTTVVWGSPDETDLKVADLSALLASAPDASVYDVSSPQSPVTK